MAWNCREGLVKNKLELGKVTRDVRCGEMKEGMNRDEGMPKVVSCGSRVVPRKSKE